MRPIGKAVKLVVAVGPVGVRLALVLRRAVPPATAAGITNDAHHIAIASLQLGIIIHVWHDKRSENAIFLCRLCNVSQGTGIVLTAIATSYDTNTAVLAVLIPREEVHTDEVHTQFLVMLEESVDIFLATRILGHSPVEPLVFGARVLHSSLPVVIQVGKGIVCSLNPCFTRTVNPQRVVIYTQFEPLGLALGHEVFQRNRAILGHISRSVC